MKTLNYCDGWKWSNFSIAFITSKFLINIVAIIKNSKILRNSCSHVFLSSLWQSIIYLIISLDQNKHQWLHNSLHNLHTKKLFVILIFHLNWRKSDQSKNCQLFRYMSYSSRWRTYKNICDIKRVEKCVRFFFMWKTFEH